MTSLRLELTLKKPVIGLLLVCTDTSPTALPACHMLSELFKGSARQLHTWNFTRLSVSISREPRWTSGYTSCTKLASFVLTSELRPSLGTVTRMPMLNMGSAEKRRCDCRACTRCCKHHIRLARCDRTHSKHNSSLIACLNLANAKHIQD